MIIHPNCKSHTINLIILLLLCLLTYFGGIHNGFLVDDHLFLSGKYDSIFRSTLDYFTVSQSQHYQPLYYLVNRNLFKAFGADPVAYRLINILLVWAAGTALYSLLIKLNGERNKTALTAAVLFAVHPLTANSVFQITHNVVFICAIGILGALISYLAYVEKKKTGYLLTSLLLFLIALLCVEAALLMPVYLFAILVIFKEKKWRQALLALVPYAIVIGLFLIPWFNVALKNSFLPGMPLGKGMAPGAFLSSYAILLGWYVQNLFWPHSVVLSFNILKPAFSGGTLLLLSIGIGTFLWWWRLFGGNKENRLALIWAGMGFIYVVPGLLSHAYMGTALSPHWMLVPSLGFFMLAARLLTDMKVSSNLKLALVNVLIAYFIFFTIHYQRIAAGQESFCRFWLKKSPDNAVAMFELATVLGSDRPAEAVKLYESLLRSGSYAGHEGLIYANMASNFYDLGDLKEAEELARRALETKPDAIVASIANNTLGILTIGRGDSAQAKFFFERAVALNPRNPAAVHNLSDLYILGGEDANAIHLLESVPLEDLLPADRQLIMARLAGLHLRYENVTKGSDYLEAIIKDNPSYESFLQIAATLNELGFEDLSRAIIAAGWKTYPERAPQAPAATPSLSN